ncbi:Hsp33 protein-domain-containing protein [Dunaliella salina]|uniref:Hsp33 protein-domain-containing protein n=1 Tax=Dunaliella salina TaxID=3046 RepID=A0ABQ7H345_DUNSA|nr:Hsp33 protein-domain-containing protein [Dunaliella salina]|eukprot:KAF5841293.1 Hsp33 protein-domain-containing protein [Dunaliella salina]
MLARKTAISPSCFPSSAPHLRAVPRLARVRSMPVSYQDAASTQPQDVLIRSLSGLGEVAVLVVNGTHLVTDAASRHKTAPTATAALGRALLGTLLMGSFRKEDEAIQVTFRGNGPLGNVMCIADTKGQVKGKVDNPSADPPLYPDGKLAVGDAVGTGVLAIVRSHPLEPTPYTGIVPIVSGEIADDLANYLVDSEQTNTALGLGVSLNREAQVKSAGGFLISILPFCSEETLERLEQNLSTMPTVSTMLNQGMSAQDISDRILEGLGTAPGSTSVVPRYGPCEEESLKERMMRAVAMLGEEEVADIQAQIGKIEVTCEFCQTQMQFSEESIMQKIREMRGAPDEVSPEDVKRMA